MTKETRYKYEKRIKELRDELFKTQSDLRIYKSIVLDVYGGCCDALRNRQGISIPWILEQCKRGLR